MPPIPTMSLRAPVEHQTLIRDVARALRDRPELADILKGVLQDAVRPPADDAMQDVLQRIAEQEAAMQAVLQRIAEQEAAMQDVLRRTADAGPGVRAESARRRAEREACRRVVTDHGEPADDGPAEAPETANGDALWKGQGPGRRLTEHGRNALQAMVADGASHETIADRFGIQRTKMARFLENNLRQ